MSKTKSQVKPLVSFLTVNFNQALVTIDLLTSLSKINYENWEIILVDNGSKPSNLKEEAQKFDKVKFIHSTENLGFAGGNNIGLEYCNGDYIFFINNDTEVNVDLLDNLVPWMEKQDDLGILSPKLCYFHDKNLLQYAGATPMSKITIRNAGIGWKEKDDGQYDEIRETAYIHGAAMIVPKKVLQEVGPMYEDYFLYYEEYDWCERIAKAGYKVWYYGLSLVYHKESVSTGQDSPLKIYYLTRNRLLFARRNNSFLYSRLSILYFGIIAIPKNVLFWLLKGRGDLAKAFWKGFWWNLTHKA